MAGFSWPSEAELNEIRKTVSEMARADKGKVRVVVSPYRICPLGAHIDHQGGTVSAMTINKGILLGFTPSGSSKVVIRSRQFQGEVRFRVDEVQQPRQSIQNNNVNGTKDYSQQEECEWGRYARGAVYALQSRGNNLSQVGVAYLLAMEHANNLSISPKENIDYDRLIENEYLGLKNGIMDQSAILLSCHGCLMFMNCKTKEHTLVHLPKASSEPQKAIKILLALSGLKEALTNNPGYNRRVTECQEAARILLRESGDNEAEIILSNVKQEVYEAHKGKLEPNLAKRAEHYFSENMRVMKGREAWALGEVEDFGKLITASGLSSIRNYECGAEPLIQLYEILLKAPGVLGSRFSGAGFRGCCIALVKADRADEAAAFVRSEYLKVQPGLASRINEETAVLICESGDCARII